MQNEAINKLEKRIPYNLELYGDYSKFNEYQPRLQNIYYTFAMWMAEGEL